MRIPAGTTLTLSLTALNRSLEIYGDDADSFRPDRWLEPPSPALEATRAYAAVPGLSTFTGGTRGCIGARFAMVEIKAVLAVLVDALTFAERDEAGTPVLPLGGATVRPSIASEPERGTQLPLRVALAA